MPRINEAIDALNHKVLFWGEPKGGKTTLIMTGPQPIICLMFDQGSPTLPPGIDPSGIWIKSYPVSEIQFKLDQVDWKRPTNIFREICQDLISIRGSFQKDAQGNFTQEDLKLIGERDPFPRPRTVVLDGWTQLTEHLIDWMLGVDNKTAPEDYGTTVQRFWGNRLVKSKQLILSMINLPCNLGITTWSEEIKRESTDDKGRKTMVGTGVYQPSMGGQLSGNGPGRVDTSFYCYSDQLKEGDRMVNKFYVRTIPNGKILGVGSRNHYGLPPTIDVTMTGRKDEVPAWNRIWKEG